MKGNIFDKIRKASICQRIKITVKQTLMNRRKTDIDMNNLKLYIARDEGKWDEDVRTNGIPPKSSLCTPLKRLALYPII